MVARRPTQTKAAPVGARPAPPAEQIEAAAFDLFARQGYHVTTVRDVMRACGLTQGALYNHFASKDELLSTIIRSTQSGLERECLEAIRAAGADPAAQLRAFVRTYVLRHTRRRVEAVVANREFEWLDAQRQSEIRASRRRIRDLLIGMLRAGRASGAFRAPAKERDDLKILAMAILNQATYVSQWYAEGGPMSADDVADLHADMALRMVGAP